MGETALDLALKWKRLYPCGLGSEDPSVSRKHFEEC